MEQIYLMTGKIVVWLVIIVLTILILGTILLPFIWLGVKIHRFITSDYAGYYLGKTIKTEVLRNAYKKVSKEHKLYKILLKYRLRNIKLTT